MAALNFARQAFSREKPHSSTTDWVDILTSSSIDEEAYDGIPELVDSINLQAAGPAEASRALRKKLKHGNSHQQYRALVLLKALVENCGHKFQTSFADSQLTDTLKHLAIDAGTDKRVYKKLMLVLISWRDQFKGDSSMSLVAGLYQQCRGDGKRMEKSELAHLAGLTTMSEEKKKQEKAADERRRIEKEEAAARRLKEASKNSKPGKQKKPAFDFEKDKPKVLSSIVDASQASNNLVNAITLVNTQTDSLQTNERVQDCLEKTKQSRKVIVRYIQLVENEDVIGTLIETNERIIAALEMYDKLSTPDVGDEGVSAITSGMAAAGLTESEVIKLQEKQRAAVERAKERKGKDKSVDNAYLHPDLEDLSFGAIGASSTRLPAPLRPSTMSDDGQEDPIDVRGSLSDFSDYESSDEETHKHAIGSSQRKSYVSVSDEEGSHAPFAKRDRKKEDDPFADPFAD